MNRLIGRCTLLLVGTLWFSGCDRGNDVSDPVALEVGRREIRLSELQAQVDFLRERGSASARDRVTFLERYLDRAVALQKAHDLGLAEDVELQHQWENLLIGRLRQQELTSRLDAVQIADDEVLAYYESNLDQYTRPAQVRLGLLFLEKKKVQGPDNHKVLRARMGQARELAGNLPPDTRGFGSLAIEYSEEGTSRFKGGDIGWIQDAEPRYRWPEAVVEAGFTLSDVGMLSEIIETDDGFYLLKKLDGRDAVVRPLDARLRASLENKLLREKRDHLAAKLTSDWGAKVAMTLHEDVLTQLEFKPSQEDREKSGSFSGMP